MTGLPYLAALVLAAVLAWAAVAKLRTRDATAAAFRRLGLPAPGVLAPGVPAAELGVAVGLVVVPGWAAAVALALLAAFTTVLVRALREGTGLGCGCFGSTVAPVSPVDLVRNAMLAACAVVALAAAEPVVPDPGAVVVAVAAVGLGAGGLAALGGRRARVSGSAG